MTTFADLDLAPEVLKAVQDAGYETPTPIQAQAIPEALKGRDVLGIAQTGTGKTASFTLPMITMLAQGRTRARMPRSLVLAPTRELAAQVAENFDIYSKYTKLSKALLIGGVSFKEQERLIDRGVDVLIATPGRLLDHFERGKLLLTGVQIMVVDEADRMLDMGFIPDIERIFKLTPFTRQTLFFSATMAPEITRITQEFLVNPVRIEVARQATTSETIDQRLIRFKPSRKDRSFAEKRALLRAVIEAEGEACQNGIIFCNRKIDVDVLMKSMRKHGYNVGAIHGDLDQSERMRVLNGFRDGSIRFLIASDVAARGLDIPNVSHVFNFDVPVHSEDYVHRIGRTGRAGREGRAIMLATPADEKALDAIERLVKQKIPEMAPPALPSRRKPDRASDDEPGRVSGAGCKSTRSSRSKGSGKGSGSSRGRKSDRMDTAEAQEQVVGETTAGEAATAPAGPAEPVATQRAKEPPAQGAATSDVQTTTEGTATGDAASDTANRAGKAAAGKRGAGKTNEKAEKAGGRVGGRKDKPRDAVIGMGEHVPAFLTRSFRPQSTG